jgi:hypothetical protein
MYSSAFYAHLMKCAAADLDAINRKSEAFVRNYRKYRVAKRVVKQITVGERLRTPAEAAGAQLQEFKVRDV